MLGALRRLSYFDPRMRAGDGWTADIEASTALARLPVAPLAWSATATSRAFSLQSWLPWSKGSVYGHCAKPDAIAEWRDLPCLLAGRIVSCTCL